MEAKALCAVFAEERPPVSSMKGYFGHTSGAAGVIETALCLMAMREQTVPANLGLRQLDPSLGTLNVPREHLHLDRLTNVLTLKCGFGGVNGVLVLSGKRAA
jgi:3-oxoacyl-(acyl-carrier-protein) synthase